MGIFSRFRDIISSNLNAMLEKAEDPEKLIKLMIQEMEDTLVEMKASCASTMANRARIGRHVDAAQARAENWEAKARLALEKGREDLAREAIQEKRNLLRESEQHQKELTHFSSLIDQYQIDIRQLEEKLQGARNKHRVLIERHIQAHKRNSAQNHIRKMDSSSAFARFEQFENRIDRMEADADLVNYGRKPTLDDEFSKLQRDDEIEQELEALKKEFEARETKT